MEKAMVVKQRTIPRHSGWVREWRRRNDPLLSRERVIARAQDHAYCACWVLADNSSRAFYWRSLLAARAIVSEDWLRLLADDYELVKSYCESQGLLEELKTAADMAARIFPRPHTIRIGLSEDPEGGDERAVVSVKLNCSIKDAVSAYNEFVAEWIAVTTFEKRRRIGLSYDVK